MGDEKEKIELLEKQLDFLAQEIRCCPTFHGYYQNCKGECHIDGIGSMAKCWKKVAEKAAQE